MKIQYMSDLHLEFKDNQDYVKSNIFDVTGDVLVLAGDTQYLENKLKPRMSLWNWASESYQQVLLIPGNHEFYNNGDVTERGDSWQLMFRKNIGYYYNKIIRIDDIDFILTTLWSMIPAQDEYFVWRGLNDFRRIMYNGHRLTIEDYNYEHQKCLTFLKRAVEESTARHIVVVTHHLPTQAVVAEQHRDSLINSAFATELGHYITDSRIDAWIYGHSHTNINTMIGNTRIVSNQLGYVFSNEHLCNGFSNEHLCNGFNPSTFIEIK